MEDLAELFGSHEKNNDLFDNLVKLLDRQTDHKISPNVLFGFMGMFNLMSILNVVKGNMDMGIKGITGQDADAGESTGAEQSAINTITNLLNSASGSGSGAGQPDLMGLLGNVASKKKINPGLLLSLMSMLNSQNQNSQQNKKSNNESAVTVQNQPDQENESSVEKKSPDDKREVELKYDRKKG
ncbi:MAG TPA: hypothetical protein VNT57_04685 [Desulfobacteria bacterium]|nr:hypothetical protein [Desulfobacteria bacterium]